MPTFKGKCLKQYIARMKKWGLEDALLDLVESEEIQMNNGFLNVRICDGRRVEELPIGTSLELHEISNLLNCILVTKPKSSPPISSLIPKSSSRSDYEMRTIQLFNEVILRMKEG